MGVPSDNHAGIGANVIEQRRGYVAYMLRLWQAREDDGMVWRASLESALSGERLSFADIEELLSFLAGYAHGEAPERTRPGAASGWMDGDDE
jgi:hypothetical protein